MEQACSVCEEAGGLSACAQPIVFVRELMRFVDILELRRVLQKRHEEAMLVAMTPCLVDAIAERMLCNVPHQVVHPPVDERRVQEAMQLANGGQGVPLVLVEVSCPEEVGRVAHAVAAARAHLVTSAADLYEGFRTPPKGAERPTRTVARAVSVPG